MALFEYKCEKCNKSFEILTKKPTETTDCIYCTGKAKKQISRTGIVWKCEHTNKFHNR